MLLIHIRHATFVYVVEPSIKMIESTQLRIILEQERATPKAIVQMVVGMPMNRRHAHSDEAKRNPTLLV